MDTAPQTHHTADTRVALARLELIAARQRVDRAATRLDQALDAQLTASIRTIMQIKPDLDSRGGTTLTANQMHGPVAGAVQAHTIHGGVHLTTQPTQVPPAQLPAPRMFVDREHERDQLDQAWQDRYGPLWVAIDGPAGAGKTALVEEWAHRQNALWPHGVLYADLAHTDAHTALTRWLRALDYTHPADQPDQLQALWNTVTHHRQLLVVADNTDPHTARTLLPAGGGCAGIAIGRTGMARLVADGARYLPVGGLSPGAVRTILTRLVPEQPSPQVLAAAVEHTGGSALATTLTAAYLALHPAATPQQITQRQERTVVTERLQQILDSLPSSDPDGARLLLCHPGPNLTPPLSAAILGVSTNQARELLERLTQAHLLTDQGSGRYGFHTSVRESIDAVAGHRQQAVLVSSALFYRLRLAAVDERINPWRWRIDDEALVLARAAQQETGAWFPNRDDALVWVDSELANIMALARALSRHGQYRDTWRLADHIGTYVVHRKPWAEATELYQLGLEAAQADADPVAQGLMHQRVAATARPDASAALAHATQALALYAHNGYRQGIASAMEGIATTYLTGCAWPEMAAELFATSKHIHLELHRHRGAALQERKEASALAQLGEYEAAMERLRSSRATLLATTPPDIYQATRSLQAMVQVHLKVGELDQAEERAHQALEEAQTTGATHQQATILTALAEVERDREDRDTERRYLQRALELLEPTGHPDTHRVRQRLTGLG